MPHSTFAPLLLALAAGCAGDHGPDAAAAAPAGDEYVVTFDESVRAEPVTGRLILFFAGEDARAWARRRPADGPFWDPPQPIAAVDVVDLRPGGRAVIDGSALAFPGSIDGLDGAFVVQAVLDADDTERSLLEGPGNLLSEPVTVDVRRDRADAIELRLEHAVTAPPPPPSLPNLVWVELRSELLSAFYGRDVYHRAGVALPPGYDADEGRRWPTVYVIPGYGGRQEGAVHYADMLRREGIEDIAPMAVYVVLDPESPLGHHGFVDSPNNGPRQTALLRELIPHLETRFRLDPRPEARIVTGHSSGGWSSLWLQLSAPDVFGACWSSAPDPVDFSAFQNSDLYADESLYTDADGNERPSFRRMGGADGSMVPVMSVRQECTMEFVVSPDGRSGQQWDAWEAMFSPAARPAPEGQPFVGRPRPMFDTPTGRIDRSVVEHWKAFDIARLVTADWERFGPIVMERVRLSCGDEDSFYLNRAVARLQEKTAALAAASGGWTGPGYVRIVPGATHATLTTRIFQDVNREMREHLARLADAGRAVPIVR